MKLLFLDDLAFTEVFFIILAIIVFFGPKKIPEIARGLGQAVRTMKNATETIKQEIMKEVDEVNPVSDITEEIKKAKTEVESQIKSVEDIGSVKR